MLDFRPQGTQRFVLPAAALLLSALGGAARFSYASRGQAGARGGGGEPRPPPPEKQQQREAPAQPGPIQVPARSACWSIPRFEAKQPSPMRSPMVLADVLMPLVRGRRYCEVGTRDGDHVWCLGHSGARAVTGFELNRQHCVAASARQLDIRCGNFLTVPSADVSACDVFFWWPEAPQQTRCFLAHIHLTHSAPTTEGVRIYVAVDHQYDQDNAHIAPDIGNWSGRVIANVSFNETADSEEPLAKLVLRGTQIWDWVYARLQGHFSVVEYTLSPARRGLAERTMGTKDCVAFAQQGIIEPPRPAPPSRRRRRR